MNVDTDSQTKIAVASFSQEDLKAVRLAQPWAVFDLDRREIPWVFSTDELDHGRDRIDQRGIDLSVFKTAPRLLWSHDLSRPAIGAVPRIQSNVKLEDGRRGTVGLTRFATRDEHPFADQIFALASPVGPNGKARTPFINSTSVGLAAVVREWPDSAEAAERAGLPPGGSWIRKGTLVEVSVVNVGMNPGAIQPVLKGWQDAGVGRDADVDAFLGWEGLNAVAAEKALQGRLRSFVDMGRREIHGFDVGETAKALAGLLEQASDQGEGAAPSDAEPTVDEPASSGTIVSSVEPGEPSPPTHDGWRGALARACEEEGETHEPAADGAMLIPEEIAEGLRGLEGLSAEEVAKVLGEVELPGISFTLTLPVEPEPAAETFEQIEVTPRTLQSPPTDTQASAVEESSSASEDTLCRYNEAKALEEEREQQLRDALTDNATANARVASALEELSRVLGATTQRGGNAEQEPTGCCSEGGSPQPGGGVSEEDCTRLASALSRALTNMRAEPGAGSTGATE